MVGCLFVTTALITGASAGIGRELARLFAADGHDLLLVARRLPELAALSAELAGVELEFLVNNAGFGTVGLFAERAPEREVAMVDLNVTALLRLTRAVLPQMLARGRGRILNIGSTAGFQAGPYMATYYASKAFVNSFSEALAPPVQRALPSARIAPCTRAKSWWCTAS
jgi:short-subunit dehydrogenase